MKELKIKIWNEENVVLMKVLQQDENIISQIPDIYRAENGLGISSWHYPDIVKGHIFIRGDDRESDNKVCCRDFITTQKAKEYVSKVKEAVAEYNASIKEKIGRVPEGEKYWFISNDWDFAVDFETETNDIDDNYLYDIGNYFKTEKEAKQALEKMQIYTRLKRFAEEHNAEEIDFTFRKQVKYYLYFDYEYRKIIVDGCNEVQDVGQIYFTSKEIAERAIKEIGEENIKKLFE